MWDRSYRAQERSLRSQDLETNMNWTNAFLGTGLTFAIGLSGCSAIDDLRGKDDDNDSDIKNVARIPDNARVVEEDRGSLDWTATDDGTLYLFDASDKNVLYTSQVRRGQRIGFDAKDDEVSVNGKEVKSLSMADDNTYRIYFLADRESRNDRGNDRISSGRVPDSARVVDESRGGDLQYRADDAGTVYLWNNTDNRLINTFNVERGQSISVSPRSGRAALNGRIIVDDMKLNTRDEYRLLFDRK